MSKGKRVYLLWIMSFVIFMISYEESSAASKKIKLSKKNVTLNEKESCKICLKNANRKKIKWYSSNKKIATVKNGLIKAKAKGRCVVIAKYKRKKYTCAIWVKRTKNMPKQPLPSAAPPAIVNPPSAIPSAVPVLNRDGSVFFAANVDGSNKNILVLKIMNSSGMEIGTETYFWLEYYDGSQWVPVGFKDGSRFIEIGIIVRDGHEYTERIDLEQYFVGLSNGKYRITKRVWTPDQEGIPNQEGIIQTEFMIC